MHKALLMGSKSAAFSAQPQANIEQFVMFFFGTALTFTMTLFHWDENPCNEADHQLPEEQHADTGHDKLA